MQCGVGRIVTFRRQQTAALVEIDLLCRDRLFPLLFTAAVEQYRAKPAAHTLGFFDFCDILERPQHTVADGVLRAVRRRKLIVRKAEEVLPQFYQSTETDGEMKSPDVIVVDPPRKGCDEKCLETMLLMQPKRIVYVSCDSATLARDLKILCAKDYTLTKWQGYDQFSRTVHVEVATLLERVRE